MKDVFWESNSPLKVAVGSKIETISGASVTLICKSSGFPPPSLTWTRGIEASPVDEKYEIEEHTLTISNVQLADADEYTCTATNLAGQDAAKTELVVKGVSRLFLKMPQNGIVMTTCCPFFTYVYRFFFLQDKENQSFYQTR